MILVNSGAFLSISSWFCELTELIFVMIPYISSTGYPSKTQGIMGHVQVANCQKSCFHARKMFFFRELYEISIFDTWSVRSTPGWSQSASNSAETDDPVEYSRGQKKAEKEEQIRRHIPDVSFRLHPSPLYWSWSSWSCTTSIFLSKKRIQVNTNQN